MNLPDFNWSRIETSVNVFSQKFPHYPIRALRSINNDKFNYLLIKYQKICSIQVDFNTFNILRSYSPRKNRHISGITPDIYRFFCSGIIVTHDVECDDKDLPDYDSLGLGTEHFVALFDIESLEEGLDIADCDVYAIFAE